MESNSEIIEDVKTSTWNAMRANKKAWVSFIVFSALWYVILVMFISIYTIAILALGHLLYVLVSIPILIGGLWYRLVKSKIADQFMQNFATANGYSYEATGTTEGLSGSLFSIGHSKQVEDVVSGVYGNSPIRLFTYHYTIGFGRNKRTYNCMVFELTFDTHLPRILLRSKQQSFGGTTFFSQAIDHPNEVTLEGNFGDYYEFGVDEQYEIEGLQIFTPDFMSQLMNLPTKFSIEFVGSKLFIYADKAIEKRHELHYFFDIAKWLIERLNPVLTRLKDDVKAMDLYHKKG